MRRLATILALPFLLIACGGDGPLSPGGSGQAQILIGRDAGISASIAASMAGGSSGPVDFSQVESLELVIDRVEAHRTDGGAWTSLSLDPVTVDLAALPEGTVASVAAGELPAGEYNQIRFFLSSATISFLADMTVGNEIFAASQVYDLEIPSVENNGLRVTTTHFTVDGASETVLVLFDPASTTASIAATGNGKVHMSPVLHEADEPTEDAVAG